MTQTVAIEIPVAWGEMDAFGHVNNVVYLRWFESGRMALFDRVGIRLREVGSGCAPILAHTSCTFVAPVRYPDTVTVRTSITRIGNKSFTMGYEVHSEALGGVAARGDGVVVWYDYAQDGSVALPEELRARLGEYLA
jgi:acyl-CoA thioester hydrolase